MPVVEDISLLPLLDPIADLENLHLFVCRRADDAVEARIDDHLLADVTGDGVDRLVFVWNASIDVHVSAQKTDPRSGSVDDGVLFRMDTATQLVSLPVRNFELIPQAEAVFEAVPGFSGSSCVSRGNDLIISDDDGADGTAETGAPLGNFLGNTQIVFFFAYSFLFSSVNLLFLSIPIVLVFLLLI